jgi:hypothetical protein
VGLGKEIASPSLFGRIIGSTDWAAIIVSRLPFAGHCYLELSSLAITHLATIGDSPDASSNLTIQPSPVSSASLSAVIEQQWKIIVT